MRGECSSAKSYEDFSTEPMPHQMDADADESDEADDMEFGVDDAEESAELDDSLFVVRNTKI